MPRKRIIPRDCPQCGVGFLITKLQHEQGGEKFCSPLCRANHAIATREERFWAKLDRSGDCWTYSGSRPGFGYGSVKWSGKTRKAHQVAWELTHGPIPPELCVLHECDNPPCCNPAHLFLGTRLDNNRDRAAKGRNIPDEQHARGAQHGSRTHPERLLRGNAHPNAKLSSEKVSEMRALFVAGECTKMDLARKFSVSHVTVRRILSGTSWSHD